MHLIGSSDDLLEARRHCVQHFASQCRTVAWDLFVKYNEWAEVLNGDAIQVSVLQWIIVENQSYCLYNGVI